MEPNKFEKHIKKQLQKREIRPSTGAWERISERLDSPRETKSNKFLWYSVAASFIGILMVSILFFQSNNNDLDGDIQVVDTKKEESTDVQKEMQLPVENKTEVPLNDVEKVTVIVKQDSVREVVGLKREMIKKQIDPPKAEIIVAAEKPNIEPKKVDHHLVDSEETIKLKIAEIVAQVEVLEMNNDALTDAEVDSLLRKAQQEILAEKLFNPDKSIDAMALLTEVEDELDQSFRNQIFETLKKGFLKVRTAVADRNN